MARSTSPFTECSLTPIFCGLVKPSVSFTVLTERVYSLKYVSSLKSKGRTSSTTYIMWPPGKIILLKLSQSLPVSVDARLFNPVSVCTFRKPLFAITAKTGGAAYVYIIMKSIFVFAVVARTKQTSAREGIAQASLLK